MRRSALLSLVIPLVFASVALLWAHGLGGPEMLVQRHGVAAPAVSLSVHTLAAVSPLGDLMPWGFANGTLYGLQLGALLTWIAWLASSLAQYAIGRTTTRTLSHDELPAWLRRFPIHHPVFLIATRWVPLGSPVANFSAGAAQVHPMRLLCCAAVGFVPPALLMAAMGAGLIALAG